MYEIYAYGNVDTLNGIFNAIAAIMGGAGYLGLIKTVAITGLLVAAFSGLFTPNRFHGWGWLVGFLMLYYTLFLPKVDVTIIDKLGTQAPIVVGNVPLGVAFFGSATSSVGNNLTTFFETAFQVIPDNNAQLPEALSYQKNGVMFANRLIQASRQMGITNPQLQADLNAFVANCTLYDLQDQSIDVSVFTQSSDIWSLMANTNPARFSTYGNPLQIDTCNRVYTYLNNVIPNEVANARSQLALTLNPALDSTSALNAIDNQIEQAYYKTKIATAAQASADLLRQNIMINVFQNANQRLGQKLNDPAAVMLATASANASASTNSAYLVMGRLAQEALPMVRNVIEALIYAVFPIVFLLFLVAQGRALALCIKSFLMSLVWIQLWPPLFAILNYVATLASARNLAAAASINANTQALSLNTASLIYQGTLSDQAVAGFMVLSIPVIASALVKGGDMAMGAITGAATLQSAATSEAQATSKGNVTENSVSFDQQQLAPSRSSAFMNQSTDARGTTTQGIGNEAGVFRYQANLSRLATTFTFSERNAESLSQSAKDMQTQAMSEKNALQKSEFTSLTEAMKLQQSFDRSQQSSHSSAEQQSASKSTQIQTLNAISQDVNRQLGLSQDSMVGKTITASAAAGLQIPLTQIGARVAQEGQQISQERLNSAYAQAHRAIESTGMTHTQNISQEFKQSAAYQWAQGSSNTEVKGFDTAMRQSMEHSHQMQNSLTQAEELARTSQFMREWSSGAQTDFTNYAVTRLRERGQLKEDDPIKLQQALQEIAAGYAKGGHVGKDFVSQNNPLPPTPTPTTTSTPTDIKSSLWAHEKEQEGKQNINAIKEKNHEYQKQMKDQWSEQIKTGTSGFEAPTRNDKNLPKNVQLQQSHIKGAIREEAKHIHKTQQDLGEQYNDHTHPEAIHPNHGSNPAVLDNVGVQTEHKVQWQKKEP